MLRGVQLYTLQILDDDDLPVIVNFVDASGIEEPTSTISENGTKKTLIVGLSRRTERTVTIPFTFADHATVTPGAQGAGAAGDYPIDYYYSGSTGDWTTGSFTAAGSITIDGTSDNIPTSNSFDIIIQSDDIDEWDEKIIVTMGTLTNGQKGTASSHILTITDQSSSPTLNLTMAVNNSSGEETQSVTDYDLKDILLLTEKSGKDITFTIVTEKEGNGAFYSNGWARLHYN